MKFCFFENYFWEYLFQGILFVALIYPSDCFSQNNRTLKIQGIPQIYIQPEITLNENNIGVLSGSCWTVYSLRDQNLTYADPEGRTDKARVRFLEAFFVENETNEFLHIYSDNAPDLRHGILSPSAIDKGWIRKNTVLMWKHCLLTKEAKHSIQAMTYQYSDILDIGSSDGSNSDGIPVYSDPRLLNKTGSRTKAKEIYYIYKTEEKAILIGNANRIPAETPPGQTLIGWVPSDHCFQLDSRVWIARNNQPEAIDEMTRNSVFPCLFMDEKQAEIFRSSLHPNKDYMIWQWDPGNSSTNWFPFTFVTEKEGLLKVRVVEKDFTPAYGPSRLKNMDYPLFRKVILISAKELNSIISNMSGLIEVSEDQFDREGIRKFLAIRYQEEYPDLQEEMINNFTFRQIFESIFRVTRSTDPIMNLKLRKISDAELVSKKALETIVQSLKTSLQELKQLANYSGDDAEVTFISNDVRYYWINLNLFY